MITSERCGAERVVERKPSNWITSADGVKEMTSFSSPRSTTPEIGTGRTLLSPLTLIVRETEATDDDDDDDDEEDDDEETSTDIWAPSTPVSFNPRKPTWIMEMGRLSLPYKLPRFKDSCAV